MYALNLAEDGRILSATYPKYAPADAVIVNALPEGDIADYLYINGEFIYNPIPIPEPEVVPTQEERIAALEEDNKILKEENAMLTECVLELSSIVYA